MKATASTTGHSDESTTIRATLERKSLGELRILAKKLALSGYSSLRKADLIDYLTATDPEALSRLLFPNWWAAHHNHVYGAITILGVALAVAFFVWQQLENSRPTATEKLGPSTRIVTSIETPIRFADFAALPPSERHAFLTRYLGEPLVWEGYLSETVGFEVGSVFHLPFETDVQVRITPARARVPQIKADCRFGELQPTDSGGELATRLNLLSIGQRIRISGQLAGDPDHPILQDAFLEAEWPVDE